MKTFNEFLKEVEEGDMFDILVAAGINLDGTGPEIMEWENSKGEDVTLYYNGYDKRDGSGYIDIKDKQHAKFNNIRELKKLLSTDTNLK